MTALSGAAEGAHDGALGAIGIVWAVIFIGVPAWVAGMSGPQAATTAYQEPATQRPITPPPRVEPLEVATLDPVEARAINAAVPFSTAPNPPARPLRFAGDLNARTRATDCLAAAMLYEAGDDVEGERAVAQVVLNRLRHPAFPKTVCEVVFQGQERRTGCQFTFTCDGAMARIPDPAAWERARQLAAAMLSGDVYRPVGHATHYHTDWVVPYWSASLDKITAVGTHLFFRWQGWWGTPGAFNRSNGGSAEPIIAKLAALSPAHQPDALAMANAAGGPEQPLIIDASADKKPALALGPEHIGQRFGAARLLAIEPGSSGYLLALDRGANPEVLTRLAQSLCTGRPLCRLMGWTSGAPKVFPLPDADLERMSWSYIRRANPAFERMLFNCAEYAGRPANQCMVDRIGTLPRGLTSERPDRQKPAVEIVKLRAFAPASADGADTSSTRPDAPAP